jgi:hypothetical protein
MMALKESLILPDQEMNIPNLSMSKNQIGLFMIGKIVSLYLADHPQE